MELTKRRAMMQRKIEKAVLESGYKLSEGEVVAGRDEKVEVTCNIGHTYKVRYSTFMRGSRCDRCVRDKKVNKAKNKFLDILKSSGYTMIGIYRGSSNKVEVMCDKGHVYGVRPYSFNKGHRCGQCAGSAKFTTKYFKEWLFSEVGDEYTVFGDYKNNQTKMLMRHNNESCESYEWMVMPVDFKNKGSRCPKCADRIKYDTETFKIELAKIHGSEYTVTGKYVNSNTKILIRHNTDACKHFEWKIHPWMIKRRDYKNCPRCRVSTGEDKIATFLEENGIDYEPEKKFESLVSDKSGLGLRYDFYVKRLNLLIEYDGQQHFEPVIFSREISEADAMLKLKDLQQRDKIKDKFAKSNKIKLLRIPYWKQDCIDEILKIEILGLTTS